MVMRIKDVAQRRKEANRSEEDQRVDWAGVGRPKECVANAGCRKERRKPISWPV